MLIVNGDKAHCKQQRSIEKGDISYTVLSQHHC